MSVPPFVPLTKPTAAQLNAISRSQAALWAISLGGVGQEPMAAEWGGPGSIWIFQRVHRWLLYDSTGQLADPSGVNDPVSLADPPSGLGLLDLNTIAWLAPGMFYRVTGCAVAWERSAPPAG
ncbi:hypothetical protein [Caldilinea sp.]|uniref:hypothetical protein n=1 Tax=Caldilinea sp. TaxID=2293560 RepID=UPI002BF28335|nr:hypothetical protein [Anaerolineales bacterium]HQY93446.1 hypothetical protein [Caldilinea sp.]